MSVAFRIDLNRCTGCEACVVACAHENQLRPGASWRQVVTFNDRRHPRLPVFHLSLACNHCAQPACRDSCPAGVYVQDQSTGAVISRTERCIGCRFCSWACPYDAPRFDQADGVMRKCTFCIERLASGHEPACVALCPTGALERCEREESPAVFTPPGFPVRPLGPAVQFAGAARTQGMPRLTNPSAPPLDQALRLAEKQLPHPKISFRSEWPLAVFTTMASLLPALLATGLSAVWFLGIGALALAVSGLHLGRRVRAWRAVCNWRHSWLSREIFLFLIFLALGGWWMGGGRSHPAVGVAAGAAGIAMLYSIDRLYQVALHTGRWNFHSAHTLLNGLYLWGILAAQLPLALLAIGCKLALYAQRKVLFRRTGKPVRPWWSVVRVVLGFAIPLMVWDWPGLAVAAAVLGDLIDRGEFYEEMEVVTPRRLMLREYQRQLNDAAPV